VRGDHAVEFPQRHDHAQIRPRARGRLHHGLEARHRHSILRARDGGTGRARRNSEGVFSVLTGGSAAIGGEITSNPIVRKLTFTGSTAVGKILLEQCSKTVKKTSMELGGNAPFIVFDDADLDAAVEGALASKYRNTGQTCVCANRLLIQDKVYDAFAAKLTEKVKTMKVGNGMEPGVVQGPLIDKAAVEKSKNTSPTRCRKARKVLTGGKRHALGGTFFEPTVLANVNTTMKVTKEETFGPVAPLFRFKDEKEAIKLANDTEFGLASYFYGRDLNRMWRVAEALEYASSASTPASSPPKSRLSAA